MNQNDPHALLERAFGVEKEKATHYIADHNQKLPTDQCPGCGQPGHVPGLPCPNCGYKSKRSWAVLRDTEWGYEAVALNNHRHIFARFRVDETTLPLFSFDQLPMPPLAYAVAQSCFTAIAKSSHADLRAQLLAAARRYADLRAEWALAKAEQRREKDAERSRAHDAFIDACNVLSRAMAQSGEDTKWREDITRERKAIGDFACYLHLNLSLSAR